MARVAFVGLGTMGGPMARHLAAAGHDVTVFNRTIGRAQQWVAANGGRLAATPRDAAAASDVVMVCVGNDDDVRSVVNGSDGVLAGLRRGGILVDHTTTSAVLARELAGSAAAAGVGFVDAPVSGGQAGAENGVLTVMCGADDEDVYVRARDVIMSYARACERLGAAGSGQLAKMVNQICIAGIVEGLSEGINFAQRAGLDVEQLVAVISQGAAGSWQMVNRSSTMARDEFNFGFAVEWMRKDLGFCLEEARRNGAKLPVTELVDGFYAEVEAMGGRRWDTSSLIARLR
ncbi:MAG: NAD(P)-dependent oxidoreductase [Ilumatobacteraceae bacterium]|nr:NAD(P)-dependent oxidoreductase [Ilumatobacteraceae bacterium]